MFLTSLCSLSLLLLSDAWADHLELEVEIPNYAIRTSDLRIKCLFDATLVGNLTWYKDGRQFFRYSSSQSPRILFEGQHLFKFDGFSLKLGELLLRNVSLEASGRYKCEVSERTDPQIISSAQGTLTVIDLPTDQPKINVIKRSYEIGEILEANCSTVVNQPTNITLRWRINHENIEATKNSGKLIKYSTKEEGNETKFYYVLGFKFAVEESEFNSGIMKLECRTTIPGIFHESTIVFIKRARYQSQALTRASRVRRGLDVSVVVPLFIERNAIAILKCVYTLHGAILYSVKWYKGTKQFYQYIPAKKQPKSTYSLPHLQVDLQASKEGDVYLRNLSMDATGLYKCEVITEAPHFYTKFGEGQMTVIDLPESAPVLSGVKNTYPLGEEVHINCSSLSSKPAASLQWQINDKVVDNSNWLMKYPIAFDNKGLETAVLGLQFIVTIEHFSGETMRLKCRAKIGEFYFQSQESVILHTKYLQMTQENHSYYMPSFFFNSVSSSKCSKVPLTIALFTMHRLLL